ncbi:MAG: hypothetical protein ACOY35_05440 [Bacillota bacterium]
MNKEEFQSIMIQQFNKVFEKLESMENRLSSLEKGQSWLETSIENEVLEKICAISDGFELRCDQIESLNNQINERLDSIEIDTGYLVSRVARLEKAAK